MHTPPSPAQAGAAREQPTVPRLCCQAWPGAPGEPCAGFAEVKGQLCPEPHCMGGLGGAGVTYFCLHTALLLSPCAKAEVSNPLSGQLQDGCIPNPSSPQTFRQGPRQSPRAVKGQVPELPVHQKRGNCFACGQIHHHQLWSCQVRQNTEQGDREMLSGEMPSSTGEGEASRDTSGSQKG